MKSSSWKNHNNPESRCRGLWDCTVQIQRQLNYAKESIWSREPINMSEKFLLLDTLLTVKNAQSKLKGRQSEVWESSLQKTKLFQGRFSVRKSFSLVSLKFCSLFVLDYYSRTSLPLKDEWQSSGCSHLWWLTLTQLKSAIVASSHSHAWLVAASQWSIHTTGAASLPTSSSFTTYGLQLLDSYTFLRTGHQEQKRHLNMTKEGYDGPPHILIWC